MPDDALNRSLRRFVAEHPGPDQPFDRTKAWPAFEAAMRALRSASNRHPTELDRRYMTTAGYVGSVWPKASWAYVCRMSERVEIPRNDAVAGSLTVCPPQRAEGCPARVMLSLHCAYKLDRASIAREVDILAARDTPPPGVEQGPLSVASKDPDAWKAAATGALLYQQIEIDGHGADGPDAFAGRSLLQTAEYFFRVLYAVDPNRPLTVIPLTPSLLRGPSREVDAALRTFAISSGMRRSDGYRLTAGHDGDDVVAVWKRQKKAGAGRITLRCHNGRMLI